MNVTNGDVRSIPLTGVGRLVLWSSIAVDDNLTAHFMWTQVDPDGEKIPGAYCAAMRANMKLDQVVMVSSYNQNLSAIPRPHLAWDGVSFLHVAWTETDRGGDERVASSVTYGKMNLQNNSFTQLRIAEFDEPLKDATVAPGPDGSAYVVWQFQNASSDHGSIFVSQISKSYRIAFSKQIKHPDLMESVSLTWQYRPIPKIICTWFGIKHHEPP